MRNRMYGGVRGRKTKVGEKLLCFPPTRSQALWKRNDAWLNIVNSVKDVYTHRQFMGFMFNFEC